MKSNHALDEIVVTVVYTSLTTLVAVTSECCWYRVICKTWTGTYGTLQTVQTQIRRRVLRRLIRDWIVCLYHRKLKVKWNNRKSPFRTIFSAHTRRQSTHQCYLCFDYFTIMFHWCGRAPYSARTYICNLGGVRWCKTGLSAPPPRLVIPTDRSVAGLLL